MNRLAASSSPYLLQHADNPVDWYPWGDEAFERARTTGRPLLVSVGYSSCHWCHVMEHESFSIRQQRRLMNELFVNVKVDREERPDIDALTMEACVTMTGQGGWPTTVFLTPDGRPFYAGTYFPPEPRHGLPSFRQLLQAIAEAWRRAARRPRGAGRAARVRARRRNAARGGRAGRSHRRSSRRPSAASPATTSRPSAASAPRRSSRPPPRSSSSCVAATKRRSGWCDATLDGMAAGGLYDVVGGGFHRYSVDERWLVPHFEKMLYDNALLDLRVPPRVGRDRRGRAIATVVEETVGYLLRELLLAGRRLRLGAGRRHGRHRGADVHVDAGGLGGARARAGLARAVRARPLDRARRPRRPDARRACSTCALSGRSRSATTRRSRPGTASRSRRSPSRPGGSSGTTGSRPPCGSATSFSGRSAARTAAC